MKPSGVICLVRSGLNAYGLTGNKEFKMGIYVKSPTDFILKKPNNADIKEGNATYYELTRFQKMAIRGYPRVIELLFADEKDVIKTSPAFEVLRSNRGIFLTKSAATGLYNMAKGMYDDFRESVKSTTKVNGLWISIRCTYTGVHAANAVRLMRMAGEVLEGDVLVKRTEDAEELNDMLKERVVTAFPNDAFMEAQARYEALMNSSNVPDNIDEDKLGEVLLKCCNAAWGRG